MTKIGPILLASTLTVALSPRLPWARIRAWHKMYNACLAPLSLGQVRLAWLGSLTGHCQDKLRTLDPF
jgi:hypothetical protein